jgi:hypothetical protein
MADNNKAAIWAAIIGALGVVLAALVSSGVVGSTKSQTPSVNAYPAEVNPAPNAANDNPAANGNPAANAAPHPRKK